MGRTRHRAWSLLVGALRRGSKVLALSRRSRRRCGALPRSPCFRDAVGPHRGVLRAPRTAGPVPLAHAQPSGRARGVAGPSRRPRTARRTCTAIVARGLLPLGRSARPSPSQGSPHEPRGFVRCASARVCAVRRRPRRARATASLRDSPARATVASSFPVRSPSSFLPRPLFGRPKGTRRARAAGGRGRVRASQRRRSPRARRTWQPLAGPGRRMRAARRTGPS